MVRFALLLFFFLPLHTVFAQPAVDYSATTCDAFQVVPGMNYRVSVTPDRATDVVVGVESEPDKPMTVLNGKGAGFTESYNMQATSDELQVCVYSREMESEYEVTVIGDDQLFPFFKWRDRGSVILGRDSDGIVLSYRFNRIRRRPVESKPAPYGKQVIAADSGILYTFKSVPNLPFDLFVVPETNHLDLAVHAITENGLETSDNDRAAGNLRQTNAGQVEFLQVRPKNGTLDVVVANKSGFGGSFLLALRSIDRSKLKIRHESSRVLTSYELDSFIVKNRGDLPFIDGTKAVTFEISPDRLVENYIFSAVAVEPGLNFALIVRTDANKPPLFVQSGGSYVRSASFSWSVVAGRAFIPAVGSIEEQTLSGYPIPGTIEISIVSYGGIGKLDISLQDSVTLRKLRVPKHLVVEPRYVTSLFLAIYEGHEIIDDFIRLYRFRSDPSVSYRVQVFPDKYFDAVLIDPSMRNFDAPTALQLIDENGRGRPETIEIKSKEDFIEFAVGSVRYQNGIVRPENKKLGGTGFYSLLVTDEMGRSPELIESIESQLPNELISRELGVDYLPWDDFRANTASRLPPHPEVFDRRILEAFDRPRNAKAL